MAHTSLGLVSLFTLNVAYPSITPAELNTHPKSPKVGLVKGSNLRPGMLELPDSDARAFELP